MLVGEFSPRSVTAAQILLMTRSPGRDPHQNHGLKEVVNQVMEVDLGLHVSA